jgi:hypothetical protein
MTKQEPNFQSSDESNDTSSIEQHSELESNSINEVEFTEADHLSDENTQSQTMIPELDPMHYKVLLKQTKNIQCELEKLNNHKLIHTYNSIPRLLWFSLLKGISLGLGSVLGATVVLSALVYVLSQMEFIPIIGEWISAVLQVVQQKPEN